jgi:hypothetical protein
MEPLGPIIPRWLWRAFWLMLAMAVAGLTAARLRPVPAVPRPKGQWFAVEHLVSGDSVTHALSFVGEGAIYSSNHQIATLARLRRGCIEIPDGAPCQPYGYFPPDSLVVGALRFSPVPDSLR